MNRIESFAANRSATMEPLIAGGNADLIACTPAAVAAAVWLVGAVAGAYAVRTAGFDIEVDQAISAEPGDGDMPVGELLQIVRGSSN